MHWEADSQRWLFGAEHLLCQGIYIRLPQFWIPRTGCSLEVEEQELCSWSPSPLFLSLKGNPDEKMLPDINQNTARGRNMAFAS